MNYRDNTSLFDTTGFAQEDLAEFIDTPEVIGLADLEDYRFQALRLEAEEACDDPALRKHGHVIAMAV